MASREGLYGRERLGHGHPGAQGARGRGRVGWPGVSRGSVRASWLRGFRGGGGGVEGGRGDGGRECAFCGETESSLFFACAAFWGLSGVEGACVVSVESGWSLFFCLSAVESDFRV